MSDKDDDLIAQQEAWAAAQEQSKKNGWKPSSLIDLAKLHVVATPFLYDSKNPQWHGSVKKEKESWFAKWPVVPGMQSKVAPGFVAAWVAGCLDVFKRANMDLVVETGEQPEHELRYIEVRFKHIVSRVAFSWAFLEEPKQLTYDAGHQAGSLLLAELLNRILQEATGKVSGNGKVKIT